MNNKFRWVVISMGFILSSNLIAQENPGNTDQYYDINHIENNNRFYKSYIKTVELYNSSSEESYPVISLNSGEKLFLSFDDLQADIKNYQYTVIPYDHDWKRAGLKPYEYLEGFETDLIEEYESSLGTDILYTHFEIRFPTEYLEITKSGNYLLKVFEESEEDENTIITARFMMLDPRVSVSGKIKKGLTGEDVSGHNQKLEITINTNGYQIINPSQNLNVVVTQNRRWDNARFGIKPTTVVGDKIEYYYNDNLVFSSGNEYRHFDTKDLRHQTEEIGRIESTPEGYIIELKPDQRRSFKSYITEEDINGRRLIRTQLNRDPRYEGEYTEVRFFLPYQYPIGLGDFFILGQLTNWNIIPEGKMKYDFENKGYECSMFLKQGYYDYIYGYVESGKTEADVTLIEGNHFETGNEYMVYVYYREPGSLYDQLIGTGLIK